MEQDPAHLFSKPLLGGLCLLGKGLTEGRVPLQAPRAASPDVSMWVSVLVLKEES